MTTVVSAEDKARGPPAGLAGLRIETVTTDGTPWVSSLWGYTAPKLLFDGTHLYTAGLVGTGPRQDRVRLYWRTARGWRRGAALAPAYQPAVLLRDGTGRIHVFTTHCAEEGHHWWSRRPDDVTAFAPIRLDAPTTFANGYLGAGVEGNRVVLAGLDHRYALWLTSRTGNARWRPPRLVAPSRLGPVPRISPVYPIVIPAGADAHIVYSNCPDGSEGNTYDRVEYARFDLKRERVVERQVLAEGPLGEVTFGVDALRAADGALYVLFMAGRYKYGVRYVDRIRRRGLFLAILRPRAARWTRRRVSCATDTGQLWLDRTGALHVFQCARDRVRHFWTHDQGRTWRHGLGWADAITFLHVLKSHSGSVMDGVFRAVQSRRLTPVPRNRTSPYTLEYVQAEWPERSRRNI